MSFERTLTIDKERETLKKEFSAIGIRIIDVEKLADKVSPALIEQMPRLAGKRFEIDKLALVQGKDNQHLLIDAECIGRCRKVGKSFRVEIRRSTEESIDESTGNKTSQMFPFAVWVFDITEEELREYTHAEESNLYTFMGNRFAYNPRILSNMYAIQRELS